MDIFHYTTGFLSEPWFICVVLANFLFSIGVHIDERLMEVQKIGTLVIISALFGLVLMVIFAIIAGKVGTDLRLPNEDKLAAIVIGIAEVVWIIPYLYAMERRGATVAGPLFQLVPVFGGVLEFLLGTIPPLIQVVGATTIVFGGILLSIKKQENANGQVNHTIDWITVSLMAIAAGIIALVYVIFKNVAGSEGGYLAVGFWSSFGMLLAGIIIFIFYKPYRNDFMSFYRNANGKAVSMQFTNECMDIGGAYLTHLANVLGPSVLVVTAFNATQPIFILLIAGFFWLFKRNKKTQSYGWIRLLLSVVMITIGTVLIAQN